MKDRKTSIRIIAALLMMSVIISLGSLSVSAETVGLNSLAQTHNIFDVDGRVYQALKTVPTKSLWSYDRISVSVGGRAVSIKGFVANGVSYIPFRAATAAISGSSYKYNSSTKTAVMTASGLEISASDGCYVTYANGRALFNTTPCVIMSDGRLYIPANVFAKAIGMSVNTSQGSVNITGSYKPLLSADKFYRSDEVFWLARIIHAESKGEPLIGQIAVGNVVLNRVRSAYYPNTIYGVIFDRKYGVQFSPVLDGTIYNTPGYSATLAAKICLEGYDLSNGAFFFLAPELATSSWIPKNRKYAFTIANHDFYY